MINDSVDILTTVNYIIVLMSTRTQFHQSKKGKEISENECH